MYILPIITIFSFLILTILLYEQDIRVLFENRKFKKRKKQRVTELFPEYINWRQGDLVVYWENPHNMSEAIIQTFNSKEVIAIDKYEKKVRVINYYQIDHNPTHKLRTSLFESKVFHESTVKELKASFSDDDYRDEQDNYVNTEADVAVQMLDELNDGSLYGAVEEHYNNSLPRLNN